MDDGAGPPERAEADGPAPARRKTGKEKRPKRAPFVLGGVSVAPGERRLIDLEATRLYTHSEVVVPVHVVHGKREGPRLFVSAAIHGDEINGVEVIRRLLKLRLLERMRGTLIAVPIVNVHGFMAHSRYLPDRRDLNRCFPGSQRGSLAARLARLFMDEVVARATHGIDLHTGSNHRANLPQIRADLSHPETAHLARAFGVPVVIDSKLRDGSLREAVSERGLPILLYEGGEALRFDEFVTRAALRGILNVMRELKMLRPGRSGRTDPVVATSSDWVRAPDSGMLLERTRLGAPVQKGDLLGVVTDPFGQTEAEVRSRWTGVVIGVRCLPLVNEGDALFHVAHHESPEDVRAELARFEGELGDELGDVPYDEAPLFPAERRPEP